MAQLPKFPSSSSTQCFPVLDAPVSSARTSTEMTETTEITTDAQINSPEMEKGDRLRSLPDEIISHILSFLPTKYAVGTAVLSRRFEDLWTRVSNLDLDNRLVDNKSLESRLLETKMRDQKFCRFVHRVLSKHRNLNSLRRLRFHFKVSYDFNNLRGEFWCITSGSQLEEIDVELDSCYRASNFCKLSLSPPESLYTLRNLKVLKLDRVAISIVSAFLPSLRILLLLRIKIEDRGSLRRLISGCPVLETAHIENCCFFHDKNKKKVVPITFSPSFKNLMVISHFDPLYPIAIEAPNLEHLHFHDSLPFMDGSPLSSLHSAWVDIWEGHSSRDDHRGMIGSFPQISNNAKEMFLSGQTLLLLSSLHDAHQLSVVFPKLTHLTVGVVNYVLQLPFVFPQLTHLTVETRSIYGLHSMLNSATGLQSLVVIVNEVLNMKQEIVLEAWESEPSDLPADTPECLLSSLEEIEIRDLAADKDDMKILSYLLKTGIVLKKMSVHTRQCVAVVKREALASLLLKLPRGSSNCEARLLNSNINESDDWYRRPTQPKSVNMLCNYWKK